MALEIRPRPSSTKTVAAKKKTASAEAATTKGESTPPQRPSNPGEEVRDDELIRSIAPPAPKAEEKKALVITDRVLDFGSHPSAIIFVGSKISSTIPEFIPFIIEGISDLHAHVGKNRHGEYWIKDMSHNFKDGSGTSVNDKKLAKDEQMPLKDGDEILFGDSVKLIVKIKDDEAKPLIAASPPPLPPPPPLPLPSLEPPAAVAKPEEENDEEEHIALSSDPGNTTDPVSGDAATMEAPSQPAPSGPVTPRTTPRSTPDSVLRAAGATSAEMAALRASTGNVTTKPCPFCAIAQSATAKKCTDCGADMSARPGSVNATSPRIPEPPSSESNIPGWDDEPHNGQEEEMKASSDPQTTPQTGTITREMKGRVEKKANFLLRALGALFLVGMAVGVGFLCMNHNNRSPVADAPQPPPLVGVSSSASTEVAPVESSKTLDDALAKELFGQDNRADFVWGEPNKPAKMNCDGKAVPLCTRVVDSHCNWNLSAATCTVVMK